MNKKPKIYRLARIIFKITRQIMPTPKELWYEFASTFVQRTKDFAWTILPIIVLAICNEYFHLFNLNNKLDYEIMLILGLSLGLFVYGFRVYKGWTKL